MKFLPIVLRNIMRNKRRTILTVLSIAVSVFVFAALMSLPTVVNPHPGRPRQLAAADYSQQSRILL